MLDADAKGKIALIVSGEVLTGQGDSCTSVRNYLCRSFSTSRTVKKDFEGQALIKEKQAQHLTLYAKAHNIWIEQLPGNYKYLTRGGEARVYLHDSLRKVVKINDAVYYATWLEYLNSLLLHNIFFEDSAYTLIGFMQNEDALVAIVEQPFVKTLDHAALNHISDYLTYNGFVNTKRNDYYHPDFGIILEDMHDENVLLNDGLLFFIDTVFYTAPEK